MQHDELVLAEDFCSHYNINSSLVVTLHQMGLVNLTIIEQRNYIPHNELLRLEYLLRLHFDLNLNLEGVDVVCHLLDKIKAMQLEITMLKNTLQLYGEV